MKNSAFFPVERNRYFYGKLLSVDDFELEQKYMNDKRRLQNRLLAGAGIVTGMYVLAVDEGTISVESGYAIDAYGREVVMDAPVIKKLSLIDGFDTCMDADDNYAYLCAEYEETKTNPVYNIAGSGFGHSETEKEGEYSRTREGCRLYLTRQEPEDPNLSCEALYEKCVIIYSGNGVTIRQTMPRFTGEGQEAELRVDIENLNQRYISFSYDLALTCLTSEDKQQLTVAFDEMLYEKTGVYHLSYRLKAAQMTKSTGIAAVNPDSFRLYLAKQQLDAKAEGKSETSLTFVDPKAEMLNRYYTSAMEEVLRTGQKDPIYLAKIYMIKSGDSCIISRVETAPFKQYAMSSMVNSALGKMMMRELIEIKGNSPGLGDGEQTTNREGAGLQVEKGTYTFSLDKGVQKGQRLFSPEIFHGLGLGPITVMLGISRDSTTYFGAPGVFEILEVKADTAVMADEEKGCFTIGIRLLNAATEGTLIINWTALRLLDEERKESFEKKIFIRPGILELGVRESRCLEAVCVNMTEKQIEWSCREGDGSVDKNGLYTAPNTAGVYEITAKSTAFPDIKASVYAVVREQEAVYGD